MCSVCSGTSVTFNLKWLHQIANSDLVLVWLFITKTKTASLLALMMIVFSGWVVSIFLLCFQFVELKKILLRYLPVNPVSVYRKNPQKVIFFVRDLWVYHHRWLMSGKVPYPSDHLLQMMLLYSLLLLVFISESYINPCHTNLNLCVLFVKRGYKETETSTEFTRIV